MVCPSRRLLLIAGNVTTTDLIGNGVVALLRHPAQSATLRAKPTHVAEAVEEILRYDPPVVAVARQALEARRLGGWPVDAGQTIPAMLLAADHHPAVHAKPHRFEVGRLQWQQAGSSTWHMMVDDLAEHPDAFS